MAGDLFSMEVTSLIMSLASTALGLSGYCHWKYMISWLSSSMGYLSCELALEYRSQVWGVFVNKSHKWSIYPWTHSVFNLQLGVKHLARIPFINFPMRSVGWAVAQSRGKHSLQYFWAPSERVFDDAEWNRPTQRFLGRDRYDLAWLSAGNWEERNHWLGSRKKTLQQGGSCDFMKPAGGFSS